MTVLAKTDFDEVIPAQYDCEKLKYMLRRYTRCAKEIYLLKEQLSKVQVEMDDLTTISSLPYAESRHSDKVHADPTFSKAAKLVDIYGEKVELIRQKIDDRVFEQKLVNFLLGHLTPREHEIIRLRWIANQSWAYVSCQIFICERQCQRISERAMKKMIYAINDFDSMQI